MGPFIDIVRGPPGPCIRLARAYGCARLLFINDIVRGPCLGPAGPRGPDIIDIVRGSPYELKLMVRGSPPMPPTPIPVAMLLARAPLA